ncbi:uncharacterized protein L969DRAFT_70208 [Mixia osmundae IAM 14324]|uniref:CRAL-TRIO domain-containing protein n=1 Tax=Mixia osmundae (strain CBS 9802 / IAM 14324 / JCM 22182 / KY 12970) TaxID=764103 RepID=G7DTK7_MIXOS|nr:uncharacterized protein L969DRAFT_70208 [Mixia osmundae IAM 14324]KEI42809.1 hypothetical protein L969DRAFT_70208 [Mixia osmundae IAM 14324]GAA93854.1 hypothetical protein E5Q_00500 [Mixia osmundae IAM 14324]
MSKWTQVAESPAVCPTATSPFFLPRELCAPVPVLVSQTKSISLGLSQARSRQTAVKIPLGIGKKKRGEVTSPQTGSNGTAGGSPTKMSHHGLPAKDPLSGHPGHLDITQNHVLGKFKKELEADGFYTAEPPSHDDATLLRFLRARKFDLPKSKLMFEDSSKWRKSYKVDELYQNFDYKERAQVDEYYPKFYHKIDRDGRPIYIEQLGKLDVAKLYSVTTPERQLQALVVEYEKFLRERLPICSNIKGELVETSCTIMDLNNVGISQFWKVKNFVQEASQISQYNYPETMGKFYIINAPYLFTTVWSLVKGWLDEVTVAKITILGANYQETLLAQIPAENLPDFLGGKCHCSQGCSLSDAGPWQDEKLQKEVLHPDASHQTHPVTNGTGA